MADIKITTTEMHTGGEPLRILETGLPNIQGSTVLEKRQYIRKNLDHIRKLVIYEPRGHYDMYGVILVDADLAGADLGCIFIHNEGYSTMCGHAVIALGRYVVDRGIVKNPVSPETRVVLQCPCGPVETFVEYKDGKTDAVRFNSVPSYVFALDVHEEVPGYGPVTVDIVYGGAFYALLPVQQIGLDLDKSSAAELSNAAGAVTEKLKKTLELSHPDCPDLAFLYGTILTDGKDQYSSEATANMCVFADKEVDRSPCGSGVTSRIAQQFTRGLIQMNQSRTFKGPTGSKFNAKPIKTVQYGGYDAVIVEVSGKGHYCGASTFTLEEDDDIGRGFLLR